MEDEEAGAALLALGSSLDCTPNSILAGESAHTAAGVYSVYLTRSLTDFKRPVYVAAFDFGISCFDNCSREYKLCADAKAACEHHARTGEWLELTVSDLGEITECQR